MFLETNVLGLDVTLQSFLHHEPTELLLLVLSATALPYSTALSYSIAHVLALTLYSF